MTNENDGLSLVKQVPFGYLDKGEVLWEGHKILQNNQFRFDVYYISQIQAISDI